MLYVGVSVAVPARDSITRPVPAFDTLNTGMHGLFSISEIATN